jgi:hypothetical protein
VKTFIKPMAFVLAAVLALGLPTPAQAADAYNAETTPMADKSSMFLISEDASGQHFSMLTASGRQRADGSAPQWTCDSISDPECSASKASTIDSNAILPVCSDARSENCIVSLELTNKDGVFEKATFLRNPAGMNFAADSRYGYYGATTPSLFDAPSSPSASGTTNYAVVVRTSMNMKWSERRFTTESVVASVVPYREATGNYKSPSQLTVEKNHRGERGIGVDGHGYECAWNEEGKCGVQQDFAEGVRVRLSLRLSSEIGGWFKGRIKNPLIAVQKYGSSSNTVTVEAEPAVVAKMVFQNKLDSLTDIEKKYGMDNGMAGDWEDGFISWAEASRPASFAYLEYFRNKVADTATGSNTYWNFGTVKSNDRNNCLADTSKVLGIVTTNSIVYDGGVPRFSRGFLDYKVGGLHYQPGGKELVSGSYDLVMRSETARCLYGFSRAPLSASVSVVNNRGVKSTATTVVSEKNGWLKMAAYGFTYSKKTIKVKITKKAVKKKRR